MNRITSTRINKILKTSLKLAFIISILCLIPLVQSASAQTTQFTFQGSLDNNGAGANGNFDFEFALFDSLAAGSQIGATVSRNNVAVADGIFSVRLDFGGSFPGANRFLEIRVRPAGQQGVTVLAPRQPIGSSPYSVRSLNASTADIATTATNAQQLGGVAADQFVLIEDSRLTDARNPLPGSTNYVQNRSTTQGSSNFNVSGTGTANVLNAVTQFNIGGSRVLGVAGSFNVFAGVGSGASNTTGNSNAFFGALAGNANSVGTNNSFYGRATGASNNTGNDNSFFGRAAGGSNSTGSFNSFFGNTAGVSNTTGGNNSFFGNNAGGSNSTASSNSFFGSSAGHLNTMGSDNSFFGTSAGASNSSGAANTFFGRDAGSANTTANNNSFFGRSAGSANTTGTLNAFFGRSAGAANTTGSANVFTGYFSGLVNSEGSDNSFVGRSSGNSNTTGSGNTFIGRAAGEANVTGSNNTIIGANADVESTFLIYATAIGAGSIAEVSNSIVLGRGNGEDAVFVPGFIRVMSLFQGASSDLCHVQGTLGTCSSSLRYKSQVDTFAPGLEVVRRLRPISFTWNSSRERDLGFAAEEVEQVEPLLATYDDQGVVQGVKYKQITTVLVNAVNEQQAEISTQKEKVESQKVEIDALTGRLKALEVLICELKPEAAVCKATDN